MAIENVRYGADGGNSPPDATAPTSLAAVATAPDRMGAMARMGELAVANLAAVPLLSVRDLNVHFPITRGFIIQQTIGHIKAVNGVSFDVNPGETLGVVGESGSGKTTVARAIIQLEQPTSGSVFFQGEQLVDAHPETVRNARRNMSMVFQDPYGSLNPRMRAGNIVGEPLRAHHVFDSKNEYLERVSELFQMVGLHPGVASRYPHQFSGGQRQRIAIARSLAANPQLILLDEPVSALDVSIQAQVINLLEDLQDEHDLAYVFVAHDLSVVRHTAHRTAVMYLGKIVEIADGDEIYENPLHPYTQALLSAAPLPDPVLERKRERIVLVGDVPSPANPPSGCVFRTRCPIAIADCAEVVPQMRSTGSLTRRHQVACIRAEF